MFISKKNWVEIILFSFFSFLHFDLQSIPPPTLGYITKLGQVIHFLWCYIFLVLSAVGFYYHGVKIPFWKRNGPNIFFSIFVQSTSFPCSIASCSNSFYITHNNIITSEGFGMILKGFWLKIRAKNDESKIYHFSF